MMNRNLKNIFLVFTGLLAGFKGKKKMKAHMFIMILILLTENFQR
jgi:hypothetical protein